MKTNGSFAFLAVVVAATANFTGTADAGRVRTYGGGKGYNYRVPNLDAQMSRWHDAPLLPALRRQRGRRDLSPLSTVGDSAMSALRMEFSGKIVIVPRRNAIESVQRSLQGLGYYRGPASGTMNGAFEQALRKYQAEVGARNTGVVDAETVDSLGLNAASFTR